MNEIFPFSCAWCMLVSLGQTCSPWGLMDKHSLALYSRTLQALSVFAPEFEGDARSTSFNECRSTSESKQSTFLGFLQEIYGQN